MKLEGRLRPHSSDGFAVSARKCLRSLIGIASTTNDNLFAADAVVTLSSIDSMDYAKEVKPQESSGLSDSTQLAFAASWHAACHPKHRVIVPSTEAWARGPNPTVVGGRGRTMSQFGALKRAAER